MTRREHSMVSMATDASSLLFFSQRGKYKRRSQLSHAERMLTEEYVRLLGSWTMGSGTVVHDVREMSLSVAISDVSHEISRDERRFSLPLLVLPPSPLTLARPNVFR